MFRIVEKTELAAGIFRMRVEAPRVAASALPGQFVIVRADEQGEPGAADGGRLRPHGRYGHDRDADDRRLDAQDLRVGSPATRWPISPVRWGTLRSS